MRKTILVLAALMFATAAKAEVLITCVQSGNEITVSYDATSEASYVHAFALDVTVDNGVITEVNDRVNQDYWVFPSSVRISQTGEVEYVGTAVADPCVGPAGETLPGLDSNGVTIEMSSALFDRDAMEAPPKSGILFKFKISASNCNVTIKENFIRGGVVMSDASQDAVVNSPGIYVESACSYPACWDYLGQCHGDADDNLTVGLADFYAFRDSWGCTKDVPCDADKAYNPCADTDRDGVIGLLDFYQFRDNWGKSTATDCPQGDINGIYCP
jgi:hypothetical protein